MKSTHTNEGKIFLFHFGKLMFGHFLSQVFHKQMELNDLIAFGQFLTCLISQLILVPINLSF